MSLPARTLAMNSKNEDFPTPVSPTRRMVYCLFALVFDVLMIPFLRDSTLLENAFSTSGTKGDIVSYLTLPSSSPFNGPSQGPVEITLEGSSSLRTIRVKNCPRPVRYSRFGPDVSSSRHEHGLDDDITRTDSTDSLMKGSDGYTRASTIYGLLTPLASALNSRGTERKYSDTIGFRIE